MTISFALLVVSLLANAIEWRHTRWVNQLTAKVKDYKDLEAASTIYKSRAEEKRTLYDFVRPLTITTHSTKEEDMLQRLRNFQALPEIARREAIHRSELWLSAAGRVSIDGANGNSIRLRQFFQTFHLSVIREGSIAEVVLVSQLADGLLRDDSDRERLREYFRAIALTDLAKKYNCIAKQQRKDVAFTQVSLSGERLLVSAAPRTWSLLLNIQDRFMPAFRLTEREITAATQRVENCVATSQNQ
jgi:hypothetical protein